MYLARYSSFVACLVASAAALVPPAITARAKVAPRQVECAGYTDAYGDYFTSCYTYDAYPTYTPYTPYYTPATPTYDNNNYYDYTPAATPSASQTSSFDTPNIDTDHDSESGSSKTSSKMSSKELTVAAKAGIGVGASVGAIFLAVCCGCFTKRRSKAKKMNISSPQPNNFPPTGENTTTPAWIQNPRVETGHTPTQGYFHAQPEMNKAPEPYVHEVPRV